MHHSGKQSSLMAVEWLEYVSSRCPYENNKIYHALNGGEKLVAGYHIDGYYEIDQLDDEPYRIGFEFMGCHVHQCPDHCTKSMQSKEEIRRDYERLADLEVALDELVVMRSCEWQKQRKSLEYRSSLSSFIGKRKITADQLINAVKNDELFGILKVDIRSPKEVIEKYRRLNFPFIFRELTVTEDMLSETMLNQATKNKRAFPHQCMTLTYNADDFIVTTPLLKFYLEMGMVVTNVYWVLQYVPTQPFEHFVKELVEVRINSVNVNAALGDRAKFTLNSSVGRFGMNLSKHRNTKFVRKENLARHIRTPLLEKERTLVSEYPVDIHEVVKKKRRVVDTVPG